MLMLEFIHVIMRRAQARPEGSAPPAAADDHPLELARAAQLLRFLVDEQRRIGQLAVRRCGQHAGRRAVVCVVLHAVRRAAQQRQAGARGRQDLCLRAPAARGSGLDPSFQAARVSTS